MTTARTVKVRAWGESTDAYYSGGRIYVYDAVARHYTTCHRLSAAVCRRVRREADQDAA